MITYRPARESDAPAMSAVLMALIAAGKRQSAGDVDFVRARYLISATKLLTTVALDADDTVLGFQALSRAGEGNIYGVEPGWGVIGTHIHPDAARRGIGKSLFAQSLAKAKETGLPAIDATIGAENAEGLAYYGAMGFVEYRRDQETISKQFVLSPDATAT